MMASTSIHKHQLPSEIDTLAKVEQIVESLKEEYNISEEIYGNILVSLSEAVNNAIKHGNKLDSKKLVSFEFDPTETEFTFKIVDQGGGFNYDDIPDPTHPDNLEKPDGRGIFIMRNLSDKVEFNESGSEVKISFNRH
ncbi:MAG: ATP-binding protein [Vicingaceae bacterium]